MQCYAGLSCCQSNQEMGAAAKERLSPKCFFLKPCHCCFYSPIKNSNFKLAIKKGYLGVSKNREVFYPPKWMVKISWRTPIFEWMIWGFSHIFGSTPTCQTNHSVVQEGIFTGKPRENMSLIRGLTMTATDMVLVSITLCHAFGIGSAVSSAWLAGTFKRVGKKRFERMKRCDFNFWVILWANDWYT